MPISLQTAENEYKKNPDLNKEDIRLLLEWKKTQPHLPEIPEVEMIVFHHSCYYDMEMTKTTIDKYFTMRTHLKHYFEDRDPSNDANAYSLERMLIASLPTRTPEGYKVIYMRFLDSDPHHFFYETTSRIFAMMHDLAQAEEGTYPGYRILVDLEGMGFGLIGRLGLVALKDTFDYLQQALPVRLKGFHILNTPTFMSKFLAFLRPFMTKELQELIQLHPAPIETIYKFVPKEAFPKEMGGKFHSYEKIKNDLIERLKDNKDFYLADDKRRVDESKRPKSPSAITNFFKKMW